MELIEMKDIGKTNQNKSSRRLAKKKYVQPDILSIEVLEVLAANCQPGKAFGNGACNGLPSAS